MTVETASAAEYSFITKTNKPKKNLDLDLIYSGLSSAKIDSQPAILTKFLNKCNMVEVIIACNERLIEEPLIHVQSVKD